VTAVIVHVGVGKTGTTSIQENILVRHPQVLCAGRPLHRTPEFEAFHFALTREEDRVRALRTVGEFVEAAIARARGSDRRVVISDETLSRAPLTCVVAERLRRSVPAARILLTIRNQLTIIPSYYSGHGNQLKAVPHPWHGRSVSFDDWFAWALTDPQSFLKAIDYRMLFEAYAEQFGAENVRVLPAEHHAEQPERFAQGLAEALDIGAEETIRLAAGERRNPRRSARRLAYRRLRSWFLPNVVLSEKLPGGRSLRRLAARVLERGPAYRPVLSGDQEAIIRQRFAPGNRFLAEATGLDLASLGYPMGPADRAQD
jgi:hypothetical protein